MADLYFTNATTVDFEDVSNWFSDSGHTSPTFSVPSGTQSVQIDGPCTVNESFSTSQDFTNLSNMTIETGANFVIGTGANFRTGDLLVVGSLTPQEGALVTVDGTVDLNSAVSSPTILSIEQGGILNVNDSLNITGALYADGTVNNSGSITINSASGFILTGTGAFTNAGTLTVANSNSTFQTAGTTTNNGSLITFGTVSIQGGTFTNIGTLTNRTNSNIAFGDGTFTDNGTWIKETGAINLKLTRSFGGGSSF